MDCDQPSFLFHALLNADTYLVAPLRVSNMYGSPKILQIEKRRDFDEIKFPRGGAFLQYADDLLVAPF